METFSYQMIQDLKIKINSFPNLSKTQIFVIQDLDSNRADSQRRVLMLKSSMDSLLIINKNREISLLRQELRDLKQKKHTRQIVDHILIEYNELSFNEYFELITDYEIRNQNDSIVIFYLKKIEKISQKDFYDSAQKFENWAENNLLDKDFKVILD